MKIVTGLSHDIGLRMVGDCGAKSSFTQFHFYLIVSKTKYTLKKKNSRLSSKSKVKSNTKHMVWSYKLSTQFKMLEKYTSTILKLHSLCKKCHITQCNARSTRILITLKSYFHKTHI